MKASLIIILVIFGFSTSANIRKISANNPKPLMLVGFFDYHEDQDIRDGITTYLISFSPHFIKERNSISYNYMNMPILLKFNNSKELRHDIECIIQPNEIFAEDRYFCQVENITNLADIQSVTPIINFTFYNNISSVDKKTVTEKDIDISSFADTTIKNLTAFPHNVTLDIFYLEKIILNKSDEFILVGHLSNKDPSININLTLSGKKYNVSVTDEIKFNATGKIDEHLHGKMEETTQEFTYFIIYAEKGVDEHLIYPVSNKNIEVLGFGNYIKPTANNDAYNLLYITGNQYILNGLKMFIKFNTIIYYNNLRNLEDLNTTVEANGTLIENNQIKGIAKYIIKYYGTENKKLIKIDPPSYIEFSENGANYERLDDIKIPSDLDLLQDEDIIIERMGHISNLRDENTTSFTYDFNLTDDLTLFALGNQKDACLKYHPNNNISKHDEINCVIQHLNLTLPYRMVCFPKKNVNTNINTIKIIIINVASSSSNLRLRSLQSGTNRTILPPTNANGTIDFTYSKINYKKSKGGLSAGAIVAIVLATVAVVAALGFAIFFLKRMKATPPPIRNPSDMNIANSTSNINK